ncbi:MAG: serine hydrolase domain-containing protein [Bacteroidota bacterium]
MHALSILSFILVASCSAAQAQTDGLNMVATLDETVREEMAATHLPGAAVVIVREGQTVFKRGYGLADIESGTPVDPDRTLFRIGSITKALTALAVTRLADQGRIGLDDDASIYFDGLMRNAGGTAHPVTVRNLITHTGGFDQIGGPDRHVYRFELPLEARKALRPSLAEYLAGDKLRRVTPPGQRFRYDTYGITLAGLVAARATGLPYAETMQQELFAPAGMERSFVEVDDAHRPDLALGYGWIDGAYVAQPYEVYVTTPASSVDATPADMGRLLEALTGGGANAHGRLFSEAAAAAVLAPQFRPHSRFPGISHGLRESSMRDSPADGAQPRTLGHGGGMLGYWASLTVYPESRTGVFIVTNRHPEAGGGPVTLGDRINALVAETMVAPPSPTLPALRDGSVDLAPYLGSYAYGVHCRTCTAVEFAQGAWPRSNPVEVAEAEGGLRIRDEVYLPTTEADVLVERDGRREVFFGRGDDGNVGFFVYSTSPDTFDRIVE